MLTVSTLGTGTAFPEAERGPTCLVISDGTQRLVIDMGSGSLQKLARVGITPLDMDALFLTHAHPDHFADVTPLLFALTVPGYTRSKPLRLYASSVTFEILDRVADAYGHWLSPPEGAVTRVPLASGDRTKLGSFTVEAHPVQHTESSIGYRFVHSSGPVLAIPGDTGPCESLTALCRDADLAIVECSMPDILPIDGHMNPTSLAAMAHAANVRRLAITHRYPAAVTNDAAEELRSLLSIPLLVPDDGDTLHVDGS